MPEAFGLLGLSLCAVYRSEIRIGVACRRYSNKRTIRKASELMMSRSLAGLPFDLEGEVVPNLYAAEKLSLRDNVFYTSAHPSPSIL
jgi:hypothetical protein